MAKLSLISKNKFTKESSERKFKNRRKMVLLLSSSVEFDDKIKAQKFLDKTRRSSRIRFRNRCAITGRPRGYRGKIGLSRNVIRECASFCFIVGLKKNN